MMDRALRSNVKEGSFGVVVVKDEGAWGLFIRAGNGELVLKFKSGWEMTGGSWACDVMDMGRRGSLIWHGTTREGRGGEGR
jgi:hypothetical protein